MDKNYNQSESEKKWYSFWEENKLFKPEVNPNGQPYTIVIPPPNASGKMHTGNVLMIAIEDLLIRWHRMRGDAALWVPGTDHAGTETQITFERELKKQDKSRFQYSREELYQEIWNFVEGNKHNIETQIRQMGASVDWDRYTFTLDPKVIQTVYQTFEKMHKEGLVYRGQHMVNYCPKCGTTYSDVELNHEERTDSLYYMKYGPFTLATTRPETKFGDTAVAVNPKDKRYKQWIGKEIEYEGLNGKVTLKVIGDEFVDMKFGTGVVKVTPAHDKNDYEAGLRHNLEIKPVFGLDGKMNENTGRFAGLSIAEARKQVVAGLEEKGLMVKIDNKYLHTVALCKAGHSIEPMVIPNWFINVNHETHPLRQPALDAVKTGKVKIYPKWREITYVRWMEEMRDWPISRQNVWGIRIPMWYPVDGHEQRIFVSFIDNNKELHSGPIRQWLEKGFTLDQIRAGLQKVIVPIYEAKENQPQPIFSLEKPTKGNWIEETDTFDTWFSSGQWPLVTLGFPDSEDFKKFYPTAVLETGWEIIRLWVSRMIMFGIYLTGEAPFKDVYLHGIVKALDGRKMSKSLGNVINPEEYIEQYGVDSLRMGLISGTANGKDFSFPKDKVIAYKHFANKIWNMTRFIFMMQDDYGKEIPEFNKDLKLTSEDKAVLKSLEKLIKNVDTNLEKYRFADAAELIYQFMWHEIADVYIESVKDRADKDVALSCLIYVQRTCLELLHPFMPFITEELWQKLPHTGKSIMTAPWPKA